MAGQSRLDGLWRMTLDTVQDLGAGVLVFDQGRILGGDSAYYYCGHYRLDGEQLTLTLHGQHYPHQRPAAHVEAFSLEAEGQVAVERINLSGSVLEMPSRVELELTRLSEWPADVAAGRFNDRGATQAW